MSNKEALEKGLQLFPGTLQELAEKMTEISGVKHTQSQISMWRMRGQVSERSAPILAKALDGQMTKEQLRPDVNYSIY